MAANAFYIGKQDLITIIDYFENHKPAEVGDKVLKGFVFRLGSDNQGYDALFPDPLYSAYPTGNPSVEKDHLIKIDTIANGCPYPPGYTIRDAKKSNS